MSNTELGDARDSRVLDVIDDLKASGALGQIDFPQLVAAGDQSSGKSSVLQALCWIGFPVREGLCTRFPTELKLRRKSGWQFVATLRPSSAEEEPTAELTKYKKETAVYDELNAELSQAFSDTIDDAERLFGIGRDGKRFSNHVCCVELVGPGLTPLTLVDLPGLFHGRSKHQSTEDAASVKKLVNSYLQQRRTINLVVLSAKVELSNQVVTQMVDEVDPKGHRSLGIVTKMDEIAGTPATDDYLELLQGTTIDYRLGWYVLMNPGPGKAMSKAERDEAEALYLARDEWNHIKADQKGVDALLNRLSVILGDTIISALPNVIREVEMVAKDLEDQLQTLESQLGSSTADQAALFEISMDFTLRLKAALAGQSEDMSETPMMAGERHPERLAFNIEQAIDRFENDMYSRGHTFEIVEDPVAAAPVDGPTHILRRDFVARAATRREKLGGRPGQYYNFLVSELFYEQSTAWTTIVDELIKALMEVVEQCCLHILSKVTSSALLSALHVVVIGPALARLRKELDGRRDSVLSTHATKKQLILPAGVSFRIAAARHQELVLILQESIAQKITPTRSGSLGGSSSTDTAAINSLVSDFEQRLNIHRSDGAEAVDGMETIYQMERETFVHHFSWRNISQSVQPLDAMLSSRVIADLNPVQLQALSTPNPAAIARRSDLITRLARVRAAIIQARAFYEQETPQVPSKRSFYAAETE